MVVFAVPIDVNGAISRIVELATFGITSNTEHAASTFAIACQVAIEMFASNQRSLQSKMENTNSICATTMQSISELTKLNHNNDSNV
jgi:hypothetical protein